MVSVDVEGVVVVVVVVVVVAVVHGLLPSVTFLSAVGCSASDSPGLLALCPAGSQHWHSQLDDAGSSVLAPENRGRDDQIGVLGVAFMLCSYTGKDGELSYINPALTVMRRLKYLEWLPSFGKQSVLTGSRALCPPRENKKGPRKGIHGDTTTNHSNPI